ncbi:hypothetical protein OV142_36960 [Nannocystis sp. SCPEA4]|nr:hypothetical protein [Nannocystis sp. SCPEA4]
MFALASCDPPPKDGETATRGTAEETDTDAGSSTGGESETGGAGEFVGDCPDAQWVSMLRRDRDIVSLAIDSRRHVHVREFDARVLDLDLSGQLAASVDLGEDDANVIIGGIDDQDKTYALATKSGPEQPGAWLRKYDVGLELEWEVELGTEHDVVGAPLVAADGSVVVNRGDLLAMYDASGDLVWERTNPDFMLVQGINAQGAMVAILPPMKVVRAVAPDGSSLWEREWGEHWNYNFVGIDDDGNVVAVDGHGVVRFAADGTLMWERGEAELGMRTLAAAMNHAGELAVLGAPVEGAGTVLKLSTTGEIVATRNCSRVSGTHVALDDDGRLYLGGYTLDDARYYWFVTAFE